MYPAGYKQSRIHPDPSGWAAANTVIEPKQPCKIVVLSKEHPHQCITADFGK
jgi:hypothetical protein